MLRKFILFFFILIFSFRIHAQIDKLDIDDLVHLEEDLLNVDVTTASKTSESIKSAPGVISVITATEIDRFGASNLLEVIERVASIYAVGTFYVQQNYISIRGDLSSEYNNHTLILINGRPTRENFLGGIDFSIFFSFPLYCIDRIEIIRGPGSVLYGSNAYSGVINIITREIQKNKTQIEGGYGSFNTFNIEAYNTQVKDNFRLRSAVKYRRQSGWPFTSIGEPSVASGNRDTASFDMGESTVGAFLSANYKNLTLSALLSYSSQNHYGVLPVASLLSPLPPFLIPSPPFHIYTPPPGSDIPSEVDIVNALGIGKRRNRTISSLRTFLDISYTLNYARKASLTLSTTFNAQDTRFPAPAGDAVIDSRDLLLEISNFFSPLDNLNLLIGATAYIQGGKAETGDDPLIGAQPYSEVWYSSYMQIDYSPLNLLKFIIGGQLNKPEGVNLDFVPRFGLIFTPLDDLGAKVLYGSAFRAPFQAEQTLYDPGALAGSRSLNPEKISTLDIQFFYNAKKIQLALTYFRSIQQDLITRVPKSVLTAEEIGISEELYDALAPTAGTFTNANRLISSGFEFEAKFNPQKRLFFNLGISYQANTLNDTLRNATLAPQFMAKIGLFYTLKKGTSLGIFNNYFSAAPALATMEKTNPDANSFHFLSAKLQISLMPIFNRSKKSESDLILNMYCTNILNQKIYYPEYIRRNINTIPGRSGISLYASLMYRF